MVDLPVHTTQLPNWLARMRSGDLSARDELLRSLCDRLERLARKMLRRFPNVQRWAQTGDVLQNALLRLLRALEQIQPDSMRDFFGLAAEQMRRELLDLARHFNGPLGIGVNHPSHVSGSAASPNETTEPAGPDEIERWCAFHEGVAALPAREREVVCLVFYHGWTQLEIAELFQVNVRTVSRSWQSACLQLGAALGGALPEI